MKFVLKTAQEYCAKARHGILVEFHRLPSVEVETPACMLYTKCGSVPYLSKEMLSKIKSLPEIVNMSLSTICEYCDTIKLFSGGLAEFTAMEEKVIFCSSHDVGEEIVKGGSNQLSKLAVRSRGGVNLFSPKDFVDIHKTLKCDMIQIIGDHEAVGDSVVGKSRMSKAVKRTSAFLNTMMQQCDEENSLEASVKFASVEGGLLLEERTRSAASAAKHKVDGFVLDGFHGFGAASENFWNISIHDTLLRETISMLPDAMPRVLNGPLHPLNIIEFVMLGVDLFDTSYAFTCTERGGALCFPLQDVIKKLVPDINFELDLKLHKYAGDFSPLIETCKCYTCKNFTKGYIHHLLQTKELLASVLLSLHNLHYYIRFFEQVRKSITIGTLNQLHSILKNTMQGF